MSSRGIFFIKVHGHFSLPNIQLVLNFSLSFRNDGLINDVSFRLKLTVLTVCIIFVQYSKK